MLELVLLGYEILVTFGEPDELGFVYLEDDERPVFKVGDIE